MRREGEGGGKVEEAGKGEGGTVAYRENWKVREGEQNHSHPQRGERSSG